MQSNFFASTSRVWLFQSPPPARKATSQPSFRPGSTIYFNPRLPHGRRPSSPLAFRSALSFQSPPPARKATHLWRNQYLYTWNFNPRLPHGRRRVQFLQYSSLIPFQSPPPARKATVISVYGFRTVSKFQSPPPARKATLRLRHANGDDAISIPASRTEGDEKT